MTNEFQPLLSLVPEGAEITGRYLYPGDDSRVVIEYFYNDGLVRVSPIRMNINDLVSYDGHYIYLIEGMTYNDVYEIYSNRFGLNLIKGEDYIDNPEVIDSLGRKYLPTNPLSVRFNPDTLIVDIVKPGYVFSGSEKDRNLLGIDLNPFSNELTRQLRTLSQLFIDGREITCFEGYVPSMEFRDLIIAKGNVTDDKLLNEVLSSFVIKAFNDEVSDILIMVGPCQIPYTIRFISKDGDVPVFS